MIERMLQADAGVEGWSGPDRRDRARGRWHGRRIVFLSHSDFGDVFVVGSHELSRAFARQGAEVLHVSMPVSLAHSAFGVHRSVRKRLAKAMSGPREVEPRLWEWVPIGLLPYKWVRRWPGLGKSMVGPAAPAILRHARRFMNADAMFVDEPRMFGAVAGFQAARVIYRPTDTYVRLREDTRIAAWEKEMIRISSACVATSAPVARHIEDAYNMSVAGIVENGVAIPPPPSDATTAPSRRQARRMVYVGAVDHRFDDAAVERLADGCREWRIDIFGPGAKRRDGRPENLNYAGSLEARSRWLELFNSDVGILPMNGHPSNEGRSPMKIYEYLAAGLPVIARRTVELERRNTPGVFLYDHGEERVALRRLVDSGWRENRVELQQVAQEHSWSRKAADLARAGGLAEA